MLCDSICCRTFTRALKSLSERLISKNCCFTDRDKLDRLLFFNLYFWRNCYVPNVASENRNHFVKCSTTQWLNSLSSLRLKFSTGAAYQHLARKLTGVRWQSVSFCFTGRRQLWTRAAWKQSLLRFKITLREKLYSFFFCNSRKVRNKALSPSFIMRPPRHLKRP